MSINVEVYSITGALVTKPFNEYQINEGYTSLPLNTDELVSGIYFVTVSNGTRSETIKMVVNK